MYVHRYFDSGVSFVEADIFCDSGVSFVEADIFCADNKGWIIRQELSRGLSEPL
jgi:hypothetical protein